MFFAAHEIPPTSPRKRPRPVGQRPRAWRSRAGQAAPPLGESRGPGRPEHRAERGGGAAAREPRGQLCPRREGAETGPLPSKAEAALGSVGTDPSRSPAPGGRPRRGSRGSRGRGGRSRSLRPPLIQSRARTAPPPPRAPPSRPRHPGNTPAPSGRAASRPLRSGSAARAAGTPGRPSAWGSGWGTAVPGCPRPDPPHQPPATSPARPHSGWGRSEPALWPSGELREKGVGLWPYRVAAHVAVKVFLCGR